MVKESKSIQLVQAGLRPWQEPLVKQLIDLKQRQQLPHALLLKLATRADSRDFGWYLISTLLCHDPDDAHPCGNCESCKLMKANTHPDFTFLTLLFDEKKNRLKRDILVEQIRQLIHRAFLTESEGNGKFALIYPAEKMNLSSANSLLKTLEEPADDTTVVLLTHDPGRIPVTMRSRCQQWNVHLPTIEDGTQWLLRRGMPESQVNPYLEITRGDPEQAWVLFQNEYLQLKQRFDRGFDELLSSATDAASLVKQLALNDAAQIRQLLRVKLQQLAADLARASSLQEQDKQRLIGLTAIHRELPRLNTEDNNLNLQLQFEDMLLSLKNIMQQPR